MVRNDATGIIYFDSNEGDGGVKTWRVSCHATKDTPETLRSHFERHIGEKSKYRFIRAEIKTENGGEGL